MSRPNKYPITLNELAYLEIAKFKIKASTFQQYDVKLKGIDFKCQIVAKQDGGLFKLKHESGKSWLIKLKSVNSNLSKSVYYLFICPVTSKTCRKLYFYDGFFKHRDVIPVNYSQQNVARQKRQLERILKVEFGTAGDEMMKKYFKPTYNGQPTKRYLRILKKIEDEQRFYEINALQILQTMLNPETNNKQ